MAQSQATGRDVKNAKLRKDEQIACRSDELLALKFKDKKDVFMLSTIHDDTKISATPSPLVYLTTSNTWVGLTALISS